MRQPQRPQYLYWCKSRLYLFHGYEFYMGGQMANYTCNLYVLPVVISMQRPLFASQMARMRIQ